MFAKKFLALMGTSVLILSACTTAGPTVVEPKTDEEDKAVTEPVKLEGEVVIGGQFPLTGELAAIGNAQKNGALLAVKEINESGGIKGKELKLAVEDDQCDQTLAVNAFNKLITSDKVPAVVGSACSPSFLAMAKVAEENRVTMVSPSATSKEITTKGGEYAFRTAPSDSLRMEKFAEFAIEEVSNKKLAVIYLNNDYGINAKDDFVNKFKQLGGEIVMEEAFNQGATDFKTQLQKVKDSGAEGFYQISYAEGTGLIYKQTREIGLDIDFFNGYEGIDDPQALEIAKDALNGVWYAGFQAADQGFSTAYKAEFGEDPLTYAAESYDAVMLIAKALRNDAATGEEIKDNLLSVKNYKGASGTFSIDENGDVKKSFNLVQIVDQRPKVVKPL